MLVNSGFEDCVLLEIPPCTSYCVQQHWKNNEREINPKNGNIICEKENLKIFPASIFVASKDRTHSAIEEIQDDLVKQVNYFKESGLNLEAKRIEERTSFDIEMIKELGYCSGIENYSRYFDGRAAIHHLELIEFNLS